MTTHEANIEAMSAEIGGPLLQLGDITTASTEQQNCLKHDAHLRPRRAPRIDLLISFLTLNSIYSDMFAGLFCSNPIRIIGDLATSLHSTAIIVGSRTVLACAHSLSLEYGTEVSAAGITQTLKYVEDYFIQDNASVKHSGMPYIEKNRVPLKLYKFHVDDDWALFERSDGLIFEDLEIAYIDEDLAAGRISTYVDCKAIILHYPVCLFATISDRSVSYPVYCLHKEVVINGQSDTHLAYDGSYLERGSSGGALFLAPPYVLIGMHVDTAHAIDYEAPETAACMKIMFTDKKLGSEKCDCSNKIEEESGEAFKVKKAKYDCAQPDGGRALILCKCQELMDHINSLEGTS